MLRRCPPTEAAVHFPLDKEGWWGRSRVTHVNLSGDISEQTPPAERENIHFAAGASHAITVGHFYYPFKH